MKNWINEISSNDSIVLSSKIRLSRNLKNIPFPNKLNYIKARENSKIIYDSINNKIDDENFTLYEMWNDNKEKFNKYLEKDLISRHIFDNYDKAAFILNEEETISIMINEDDHIRLQCITNGLDLEKAFNKATIIDDKMEENILYEFDETLGYLTSNLSDVGTGMRASVVIHLPALTMSEEIKNISKYLNNNGLDIKGIYMDGEKVFGNIYEIFSKESLGITENDIVNKLKSSVLNIISQEKKFREILMSKCKYELEDKIYRSYAILKSAILLDYKETIDLLSNIRLGTELSIIDIDKRKINKILTTIGDESLQSFLGRSLESKEVRYERAKVVKEILI